MPRTFKALCATLLTLCCLCAACAPARNEPSAPEIRVSGSWEIGASKTKGF